MSIKIVLNGAGRIGKSILKQLLNDENFEIVAINEINPSVENIVYSINYDSTYGRYEDKFKIVENNYIQNSQAKIKILNHNSLVHIDLKDIVNPLFASAPILYKKMQDDSLQAAINFWHFNAKLESKNIKALIEISEILKELDIQKDVSFVGWTFDTKFANENKDLINAFLKASKESKEILKNSDEEWNRIKEQMSVKNDKEFEALKNGYKKGIIEEFDENSIGDLQKVFKILLKEGGEKFVEDSTSLDNSIFWNFDSK
mgnify:CR=1 FL=1